MAAYTQLRISESGELFLVSTHDSRRSPVDTEIIELLEVVNQT